MRTPLSRTSGEPIRSLSGCEKLIKLVGRGRDRKSDGRRALCLSTCRQAEGVSFYQETFSAFFLDCRKKTDRHSLPSKSVLPTRHCKCHSSKTLGRRVRLASGLGQLGGAGEYSVEGRDLLTWMLSCTFSISTPRNLDLTSKMPTSSVAMMSNKTFLNLERGDGRHGLTDTRCQRLPGKPLQLPTILPCSASPHVNMRATC